MSCEYCRGEKKLYAFDGEAFDGERWVLHHFDTKITHGFLLGTSSTIDTGAAGGACCVINYCPKCGTKLGKA